jgi:hypothetical protein
MATRKKRAGKAGKTTVRRTAARRARQRWSGRVTAHSDALDLDPGVFRRPDPHGIAVSLKRSADRSRRRKSEPFRSAMSMLTFYINRAGRGLDAKQRGRLQAAKQELRALYGRPKA